MSTRIKALFAAAAATGAVVLSVALQEAAQDVIPPMSCAEWQHELAPYQDKQSWHTFHLGFADSAQPPQMVGNRPLGRRDADAFVISMDGCDIELRYPYKLSPAVNGRRVVAFRAPLAVAAAWRQWSQDTPGVLWLGSFGQAVDECVARVPLAQCRQMLGAVHDCWLQDDGTLCRYGRTPAGEACAPGAGSRPLPCVVDRGAGSEFEDLERVITDAELEAE